jgi:hypothetical protein
VGWNKSYISAAWLILPEMTSPHLQRFVKKKIHCLKIEHVKVMLSFGQFQDGNQSTHSLQASLSTIPTEGHFTPKAYLLMLCRLERGVELSSLQRGWDWRCSKIDKIQTPMIKLPHHCLSLPILYQGTLLGIPIDQPQLG